MFSKRIFNKKKSRKIYIFISISLFLLTIFIYLYFFKNEKNIIIIPENNEKFYIIPKDKGGVKIPNLDKKSLNLKNKNIVDLKINQPEDLFYSIQFYVNNDFNKVKKHLSTLVNSHEPIFENKDFYILALNTEIGVNYFLLYRNFRNRDAAINYCSKYLTSIKNCLIVNVSKF